MRKQKKGSILMRKRSIIEKLSEVHKREKEVMDEMFNLKQECMHWGA